MTYLIASSQLRTDTRILLKFCQQILIFMSLYSFKSQFYIELVHQVHLIFCKQSLPKKAPVQDSQLKHGAVSPVMFTGTDMVDRATAMLLEETDESVNCC